MPPLHERKQALVAECARLLVHERKQALVAECARLLAARVRKMFIADIEALFAQILADRYSLAELVQLQAGLTAPPPQKEVES